ncbi:calcitonin receptor [Plakobranchus ocellatus]|uniref:Calcitonin receptor n=1 Tax=Plakobranchus ocellatus TaxID=259542 RepID=A0AAV3Y5H7_9GAST|nr:calcitonin receptor [Plakobranchus ocellatus]
MYALQCLFICAVFVMSPALDAKLNPQIVHKSLNTVEGAVDPVKSSLGSSSAKTKELFSTNSTHLNFSTNLETRSQDFCAKYMVNNTSTSNYPLHATECKMSGPVIHHFFKFLHDRFKVSDCRKSTILRSQSEELYCSILMMHSTCLTEKAPHDDIKTDSDKVWSASTQEQDQAFLAPLTNVRDAIEYMCGYSRRNFDRACAFGQLTHVESCIRQDVEAIANEKGEKRLYRTFESCRHLELAVMCTFETMEEACTDREAAIMAGLVGQYLKSPQCSLSFGISMYGRR